MSLRARLVAGLLVLSAVGLVLLAAITYAEQRSFLLDRTDQQAKSAVQQIPREVYKDVAGGGAGDGFGGRPPRGGPPGEERGLPAGTYGQIRTADGDVQGEATLGFEAEERAAPDLPEDLPLGTPVTVSTDDGRYRVLAEQNFSGLITVAAIPLDDVDETLDRLLLVEGLVIAGILIVLGGAAWWVVGLGLRPLDRIGDTAGAIAAGELDRRVEPADERTEVGRLGLALNAMLGRLEQAFAQRQASEQRLRRFVADASHELRTPLASIRGYSELFRMGASADPEETATAMRRIEQEAARMGVLVEDLLTLARLDEVRDPVREPVDLAQLARDAADDARAMAPEREITVTGQREVRATGDPHQLRQVLANLVRNALVHTPSDAAIEIGARMDSSDHAVLRVRDHGQGLPPGTDPAELFERFWRAEAGRARGRGGAGLGLAIVAGIVDQHGGRVRAGNAEGGGAEFVVELPVSPPFKDPRSGVDSGTVRAAVLPTNG
ncbi:MAG: HAMP domain-containing histidine kinase [Solirubrobacteraceae bacterium]|nr:HAMP domain-containing histidine kinase [Solirubrobacteraceae bacterium]